MTRSQLPPWAKTTMLALATVVLGSAGGAGVLATNPSQPAPIPVERIEKLARQEAVTVVDQHAKQAAAELALQQESLRQSVQRIETKLDALQGQVGGVKEDIAAIKADIKVLDRTKRSK